MLDAAANACRSATPLRQIPVPVPELGRTKTENERASERLNASLQVLRSALEPQRRVFRAGEMIYRNGERFTCLHVLNSGFTKLVNLSTDGREQVVGLGLRGDWLGFDGIAAGRYDCDAVAMDTSEVWTFRYDELIAVCMRKVELLSMLHQAMSREIGRDRDSLMSVCTLPADARVAEFLRHWVDSLARRGLRTDQITLRMTRAEIGNYLGMTLESVSRALSRLARINVISFPEKGRRDIRISSLDALDGFVQGCLSPLPTLQ